MSDQDNNYDPIQTRTAKEISSYDPSYDANGYAPSGTNKTQDGMERMSGEDVGSKLMRMKGCSNGDSHSSSY